MQKYDSVTNGLSAREYFMVLRLAIYHIEGENLESSFAIMQHEITDEEWELACELAKTLQ